MEQEPPKIPPPDLGWALSRTLRAPLDGLRASIETLVGNLRRDPQSGPAAARTLDAVLEQVQRMGRDVDALIAYAKPHPVAPLNCSVDEILRGLMGALPPELRSRVRITCPSPGRGLWVDGPLLSSCLARLLESSLADSDPSAWVLLQARHHEAEMHFRIFGGAGSILAPAVTHEDTPRGAHLGLGETLARRDLERMGAALSIEHADGVQHLLLHVPDRTECLS